MRAMRQAIGGPDAGVWGLSTMAVLVLRSLVWMKTAMFLSRCRAASYLTSLSRSNSASVQALTHCGTAITLFLTVKSARLHLGRGKKLSMFVAPSSSALRRMLLISQVKGLEDDEPIFRC